MFAGCINLLHRGHPSTGKEITELLDLETLSARLKHTDDVCLTCSCIVAVHDVNPDKGEMFIANYNEEALATQINQSMSIRNAGVSIHLIHKMNSDLGVRLCRMLNLKGLSHNFSSTHDFHGACLFVEWLQEIDRTVVDEIIEQVDEKIVADIISQEMIFAEVNSYLHMINRLNPGKLKAISGCLGLDKLAPRLIHSCNEVSLVYFIRAICEMDPITGAKLCYQIGIDSLSKVFNNNQFFDVGDVLLKIFNADHAFGGKIFENLNAKNIAHSLHRWRETGSLRRFILCGLQIDRDKTAKILNLADPHALARTISVWAKSEIDGCVKAIETVDQLLAERMEQLIEKYSNE